MSLHQSGEDYLEAILMLQKEKGMVRSVDVARHMGVSKPSVCHAVATLKKGGFLTIDEDFFLRLTDVGREVAEQTYEKHCFFPLRPWPLTGQVLQGIHHHSTLPFHLELPKLF